MRQLVLKSRRFGSVAATIVPFAFYRSGTSRGLYLRESDVPAKGPARDRTVAQLMGSGHPSQLEGFGGGTGPTSKAVLVGKGTHDTEVTYTFLQCRVNEASVDHSHGDCGNMLAAVAPFALERGLAAMPEDPAATTVNVQIHSLVTGALYEADVALEAADGGGRRVRYTGEYTVSGVPRAAAPVVLTTHGVAGSQTGKLLPDADAVSTLELTPHLEEPSPVGGPITLRASLVDFGRALVIVDYEDVQALAGHPPEASLDQLDQATLEADTRLNGLLEAARRAASLKMGMGDCAGKDAPKVALVAAAPAPDPGGGDGDARAMVARYWVNPGRSEVHPTMAMTAAQALGAGCLVDGSVVQRLVAPSPAAGATSHRFSIVHARGALPVEIGVKPAAADGAPYSLGEPSTAKYTTTVRPIAEGNAFAW